MSLIRERSLFLLRGFQVQDVIKKLVLYVCVCYGCYSLLYQHYAIQTFVCSLCFSSQLRYMDATQLQFYDHSIIDFHLLYLYFSFQICHVWALSIFRLLSVCLFFLLHIEMSISFLFYLVCVCVCSRSLSHSFSALIFCVCVSLSMLRVVCESCIEWGQRERVKSRHTTHTHSLFPTHTLLDSFFFRLTLTHRTNCISHFFLSTLRNYHFSLIQHCPQCRFFLSFSLSDIIIFCEFLSFSIQKEMKPL